jgi:hypothetical protein
VKEKEREEETWREEAEKRDGNCHHRTEQSKAIVTTWRQLPQKQKDRNEN